MRCPGDGNGNFCKHDCGHWYCPDCGLDYDDGFYGGPFIYS
jgi:hypothetical protein